MPCIVKYISLRFSSQKAPMSMNDEGYGTTAWAPTLLDISRNFGKTEDGRFIVTYLR